MPNGTVQLRAGSEAVREFFHGIGVTTARAHEKRVPHRSSPRLPRCRRHFSAASSAPTDASRAWRRAARPPAMRAREPQQRAAQGCSAPAAAWGIRGRIYRISETAGRHFSYTRKDGTTVEYASREGFDLRITGSDLARFAERYRLLVPAQAGGPGDPDRGDQALSRQRRQPRWSRVRTTARRWSTTSPSRSTTPTSSTAWWLRTASEYMHVDDSACNLASLNLMKFRREDGSFDVESFEHAVDVMLLAQEIIVAPVELSDRGDRAQRARVPPARARLRQPRRLPDGRRRALRLRRGPRHGGGDHGADDRPRLPRARREIAAAMGPYERYAENREPHNAVMRMHRDAAYAIPDEDCADVRAAGGGARARGTRPSSWASGTATATRRPRCWRRRARSRFLMDCDTTGVEPDFSLVKFKELVGGGQMTIVNRTVPLALQTLGYSEPADRADRGPHQPSTARSSARPACAEEHLRCSTWRSASARSRTWATSR